MKILWMLLLSSAAMAQSLVIPAQTFTTPVTINGTTLNISITVPSQTVALPTTSSGSGLPAGMTYSSTAGLTVSGPITSTAGITALTLTMTGGGTLPTSSSGLYVFGLNSGDLVPVVYTPYVLPPLTVSQASSGAITITP